MPGGFIAKVGAKGDDKTTAVQTSPLAHAKRLLLYFLQELFSEENPTGLRYSGDNKVSTVLIKGSFALNQETYNKKPIIAVERGGAQIQSRTLGSIEYVDYKRGGYIRTELVPFSLGIRVLSENEYTAEKISWFIVSTTFVLRHVLIRQGFYHVGNQFVITPPAVQQNVSGDQTPLKMIQLTLPCSHLMRISTTPLNRPILTDVRTVIEDSRTGERLLPPEEASQG